MPVRVKPGGINTVWDPVYGEIETHSSTCSHCQKITDFASRRVMMEHVDLCRGCMKLICLDCVGKPCRPYEKEAERIELEARIRENVHKQGWFCS